MPTHLDDSFFDQKGIGLLEITIVVFLLSVIIMAVIGVQRFVGESYRFSFEEMQAVEETRGGIDIMTKEIREAQPSENGAYPIVTANDQEFIFYADVDQDGQTERVRYFLEGAQLKKGVIQPTATIPVDYPIDQEQVSVVASYIRNGTDPIFYYYNGDWPLAEEGNPLSTPTRLKDTKYMRVFLRINIDPEKIPQDFELSSGAQLRNLKTNLGESQGGGFGGEL